MIRRFSLAATMMLGMCAVVAFSQSPTIKNLGPKPDGVNQGKFYISPDGGRVAVLRNSGSRAVVVIDGVEGEKFDTLGPQLGGKEGMMDPLRAPMVIFSPDGTRYGYAATLDGTSVVVVDGKVYPEASSRLVFSPDSKHFAFVAIRRGEGGSTPSSVVYRDGTPGTAQFYAIDGDNLQFSADSQHLGYIGYGQSGRQVVVDDKPGMPSREIWGFKFSPDGSHFGYMAQPLNEKTDGWLAIVDGNPAPQTFNGSMMEPKWIQFSADGKHYAYVASAPAKQAENSRGWRPEQLVVDGKAGASYGQIEQFKFSPDGTRVAYIARLLPPEGATGAAAATPRVALIVDEKKIGYEYGDIREFLFSPDSKHVAAVVNQLSNNFVVLDGVESDAYQVIQDFAFSASGRYAYVARPVNQKPRMIIDGKQDLEFDEMGRGKFVFSPDGSRIIYGAHLQYPKTVVRLDGQSLEMGLTMDAAPQWPKPAVFSPDGKHLVFQANQNGPHNLLVDMNPAPQGYQYGLPTFSADSNHFAVAGGVRIPSSPNMKWTIFVNGKATETVDEVFPQMPATMAFQSDGQLRVLAIKDNQFVHITVPTAGSTIASFAGNAGSAPKPAGVVTQNQGPGGNGAPSGNQPQTLDQKANDAMQKGVKKLKGIFGK